MQRIVAGVARIALGLWIGAVACVAFVVAPRVFGFFGEDTARAGDLMIPIFQKVDLFGIAAGLLFALAALRSRLRALLAVAAAAAAAVNAFVLSPRIAARGEDLQTWHQTSETVWGAILLLGLVLLALGVERPPAGRS